jgi:hypothetical protein
MWESRFLLHVWCAGRATSHANSHKLALESLRTHGKGALSTWR